jgi:hypothetical protein
MKVLFDLYWNSSIQSAYLRTHLPRSWGRPWRGLPSNNDPLAPPSGGICDSFKELTSKAKNRAYQRFYQALTAHWVAIEFAWLAKIRLYPESADRVEVLEEEIWTDPPFRTLQEKLDIVEIVDFVWVFLVHKIFHNPSCLRDWFDNIDDPFDDPFYPDNEIPEFLRDPGFVQSFAVSFVDDLREYLRPTHIIELLLLLTWSPQKSWNIDRFEYVRKLGLRDSIYGGGLQGEDDGYRPNNNFIIDLPDEDVLTDLHYWGCIVQKKQQVNLGLRFPGTFIEKSSIRDRCEFQWPRYRRRSWAFTMRTQIFSREETAEKLFSRIIELDDPDP